MNEKLYLFLKKLFDFVLASLGLVILSPVIVSVLIAIKLDSPGSVFYNGKRTGLDGKIFRMYKFRTMRQDANFIKGKKGFSASEKDFRLTRTGKMLRKHKLNEIPQLINVLKGEMSFVGPRPEFPYYTEMFNNEEKKILSVLPGITDFASIKFHNEAEILEKSIIKDKDKVYEISIRPQKIRLQLKYIKERNFFLDVGLILKTIKKLFYQNKK